MTKTVILDMDGTMIDAKKINVESLNKVFSHLGQKEITIKEYNEAYSMTSKDTLRHFGVKEKDLDKGILKWGEELEPIRHQSEMFPGILELIKKIKEKGYKLGIITSRFKEEAMVDVERFKLEDYFEQVVTVSEVENAKPHIDSLNYYMEKTGAKKEDIVYVGDSIHDSEFAKNANIPFYLALWGTSDPNIEATIKLKHPLELLEYIEDK